MRVAICQPLVPSYRIPVFNRIAQIPEVELTVVAGASRGSLVSHSKSEHYRIILSNVRRGPRELAWQYGQIASALSAYDLVIAPWDSHFVSLWPALLISKVRRSALVLWGHGYSKYPRPWADNLRNRIGKLADAVLLYDRDTAGKLLSDAGFAHDRVFVAQNALDQTPIRAAKLKWQQNVAELRRFQLDNNLDPDQTILFLSRVEAENAVEGLLHATKALLTSRPHLRIVIIGEGSARQYCMHLARELGIASSLIWVGALYDEGAIAPWALSASVLCYPANAGLSILHGFGYGLPVVTNDDPVTQNPEVSALVDGENSLRYRRHDWLDLAGKLNFILENSELRQQLSSGALKTVTERFTLDEMMRGFVDVIDWARRRAEDRAV